MKKLIADMFSRNYWSGVLLVIFVFSSSAQEKKYQIHTVAFYNFENLFDTINDPTKNDEEWLPNGKQQWTSEKYRRKLRNLARVLAEIGTNDQQKESATLIGCAEVENKNVLEDLIREPKLADSDYGIIHFDSPDKRGIDVALLYQKEHFQPLTVKNIPLLIYQPLKKRKKQTTETALDSEAEAVNFTPKRIYTRDVLLVNGFLEEEEIYLLVNHWPARVGGEKKSQPYREAAAQLNKKIMDSLYQINPSAKIICMGDLNDGPYNKSIKVNLEAKRNKKEVAKFGLYNPFEEMYHNGNATLFYRDVGDIFDQIMVSETLIQNHFSSFQYWKAGIYNKPFMITPTGQYKGYPLRHSPTEVGFSDHFPVYVYLIKEL